MNDDNCKSTIAASSGRVMLQDIGQLNGGQVDVIKDSLSLSHTFEQKEKFKLCFSTTRGCSFSFHLDTVIEIQDAWYWNSKMETADKRQVKFLS